MKMELREDQLEDVSGGCDVGICDECIRADIHRDTTPADHCPHCGSTSIYIKSYGTMTYSCRYCFQEFKAE